MDPVSESSHAKCRRQIPRGVASHANQQRVQLNGLAFSPLPP